VVRRHRFENIDVEFDLREGHNRWRVIVASIKDLPYLVQTPATDLTRGGKPCRGRGPKKAHAGIETTVFENGRADGADDLFYRISKMAVSQVAHPR
jgi:hypothetical protein